MLYYNMIEEALKRKERFLEDREDYLLSLATLERIENGKERTYTLEEVKKELGLDKNG